MLLGERVHLPVSVRIRGEREGAPSSSNAAQQVQQEGAEGKQQCSTVDFVPRVSNYGRAIYVKEYCPIQSCC